MKLLAVALAAGLVMGAAPANVSRAQAEAFQKKLALIVQQGETPSDKVRQTTITEVELNSYLHFSAGDRLPVGVTDPSIGIRNNGRLDGRAIVDLDLIRKKRSSGGWFDPLSYLTGRLPLTAVGVLTTHAGRGKFVLETATLSGIPIPKSFLQEIVSYYTRTPDFPNGIGIDDPFDLPAAIQKIDASQGRAVILQ
jgi:hypothetical protein